MGAIFIIDFSKTNYLTEEIPVGVKIIVETEDGGRAYKLAGELMPDKIFINYKDKPGHGRQTATAIKERKKTAHIPVYFVDGKKEENEKVKAIGICIKKEEINNIISLE